MHIGMNRWALLAVVSVGGCSSPGVRRTIPVAERPAAVEMAAELEHLATSPASKWSQRQGRWIGNGPSGPVRILWSTQLGGPVTRPLTVFDRNIICTAGGRAFRHRIDGTEMWATRMSADGVPSAFSGGLYVANRNGIMSVVNPLDGSILASHGGRDTVASAPLELNGAVHWVDSSGNLVGPEGFSEPILDGPVSDAASTGETLFVGNIHGEVVAANREGSLWTYHGPGPIVAHPVVSEATVFVPYSAHDGQPGGIVALDVQSGAQQWITRLDFGPGGPAAIGRHLVVPDKSGDLVALDVSHGGVRWRVPGTAPFTIQPMVVGGRIVAGDASGRLHMFDGDDGGTIWTIDLGSPITGEGVLVDDIIIVGTADGRLVGIGQ